MYHYIKKKDIKNFRRQMDLIKKYFNTISINEYNKEFDRDKSYVALTFDDGYCSVVDNAVPVLEQKGIPYAFFVPTNYIGKEPDWLGNRLFALENETIIDKDTLYELNKKGCVIASHGKRHRDISNFKNDQIKDEINGSKAILEEITKGSVDFLSLPFGAKSEFIIQIAREAGYKKIFSISPDSNLLNRGEHVCGRIEIHPWDTTPEFILKIFGGYRWLETFYLYKTKVRNFQKI